MTLNIVVHEWFETNLTHHLADCGGPREVTVFVGNEFFVDVELLREKGHVLVPTGNTRKSSLPQVGKGKLPPNPRGCRFRRQYTVYAYAMCVCVCVLGTCMH